MTMLLRISPRFGLSTREVRDLYNLILNIDWSDLTDDGRPPDINCLLFSDSPVVYSYPDSPKMVDGYNGYCDDTHGTGCIFVRTGRDPESTLDTVIHEFAHLVESAIWNIDQDDYHGLEFQTVLKRIAKAVDGG